MPAAHALAAFACALASSLIACAPSAPPAAPAERPPPAAPRPSAPSPELAASPGADALFTALGAADAAHVEALLTADPALSSARTPKGTSAVLVAAFTLNADRETFMRPVANLMLRAILARHPPLDVFDAAIAGDTSRLEALLAEDPSRAGAPHARLGMPPLHLAAYADHPEAVALLLARGAAINGVTSNKFRNTPLVVAMLGDATRSAALLLARGADVEIPEEGGLRALHVAAETGDMRLVALLLDHGARIDARADDGTTPLGIAVRKGRDGVASLLRSRGAGG
jgi:uncharacterized protein